MVSLIQSNYMGFGSGVVVPGPASRCRTAAPASCCTPGHPNCVGPGKRPFHTIIPGFVTKDGAPVDELRRDGRHHAAAGPRAGAGAHADYGQSPQAACDAPRFRFVQGMDVSIEEGGFEPTVVEELQRRGHRIVTIDDYNQFGSAQLIWKLDGGYFAASDPRPWPRRVLNGTGQTTFVFFLGSTRKMVCP